MLDLVSQSLAIRVVMFWIDHLKNTELRWPHFLKGNRIRALSNPMPLLPQVEQDFSAEQSSLINKAYSTLVNPLSRAIYLVSTLAASSDNLNGRKTLCKFERIWMIAVTSERHLASTFVLNELLHITGHAALGTDDR